MSGGITALLPLAIGQTDRRIEMRIASTCAGLLALSLAASTHASKIFNVSTAAETPGGVVVGTTPAATGLSTGFESPFVPGTINGQQSWTVSTISAVPVTGNNISTTTPIADA